MVTRIVGIVSDVVFGRVVDLTNQPKKFEECIPMVLATTFVVYKENVVVVQGEYKWRGEA